MGTKFLRTIALSDMVLSRFNTRRTRPDDHIDKLADRIKRNGFEPTRAPWAYAAGSKFEVFAGWTRTEAARRAGLATIPVFVHDGFSDDDYARLADEDNENDEYHASVPVIDVWAEYHRLKTEEGWTARRIADAKQSDEATALLRIKLHTSLPKAARKAALDGIFDEGHCIPVIGLSLDIQGLSPWLTTEQAQTELVNEVLDKHRGSSKGIKPTVANVREAAKRWKALIAAAKTAYDELDEAWRDKFTKELVAIQARTEADVSRARQAVLTAKRNTEAAAADRLRAEADEKERAAAKAKEESDTLDRVNSLVARIAHADGREWTKTIPTGFQLLLTDPPYGVAYQSGRRTTTAKKAAIANDEDTAASVALLAEVLAGAYGRMAEDSTVLVFTGWRNEPAFRNAIECAGFRLKGSLVWVKNNHGTGDLEGSFAPKHERIIHAVKGNPKLVGVRLPDVLHGKDVQNSKHPTEKPRDLLAQLIGATTTEGQTVVDPFAGSGSTLLTALSMSRQFYGCELDTAYFRDIQDAIYTAVTGKKSEADDAAA